MKLYRRKKESMPKDDEFDRHLLHMGGEVPENLKTYILDNYFLPMFAKFFPNCDFEDASLVRIEANGKMHTRVVICNNGGGAEEAFDVDGRMGEILWDLCRNRREES